MAINVTTHSKATMPTKAKKTKTKGDGYIKQAKSVN
jgi:hypothetical protein